ncbi:MAG: TonB-dependent receptor [Ignavibacteria bacterium]|nr:TonB-dependent receptor [Ignavibacteria bacterium]
MKNLLRFFLIIFLGTAAVLNAQDSADTTDYETDEIIISATRTEQKLIDIPFSVSRIDYSQWKSSRKMGLNDVITNVPGLILQPRYGNHDVRVSIRGFGSRSNTGIRGVRILLDGIPESEPDGQTRIEALDFTAISRIEVSKGNLSSLYTNAPGGVINFFTDKYFPTSFVMLDNEFGDYSLRKNGIKVGVNAGSQRFMATYSYQNYLGYREHNEEYQTRFNSIYEADLTADSKLLINGYLVKGLIKLPGSLTLEQYNTDDLQANPRDVSRDSKRLSDKGRLGITYSTYIGKDKKNFVEFTGYGTIKEFDRTAATYRVFTRWGVGSSFRYINKTKFGSRENEFSIGGDMFYQDGPISEFNNIGGIRGDDLLALSDETLSNIGLYFLNQIPLVVGKLNLLVTGRYDNVITSKSDLIAGFRDTTRKFSNFTPKFALNYKLNPRMAIYGSFGFGFDVPANNELENFPFSSDGGLKAINPDLNPQKSTNYEIGYKGEIPNRGSNVFKNSFVELTLYATKIDDAIIPFTVDGDVYFRNAATVNRKGLEFGFNTEVVKGLKFATSYTYSDFKYDKYSALNIAGNGLVNTEDYSGNTEPANPDHYASGELHYVYDLKNERNVFIKTNGLYVGKMQVNDKNVDSLITASYYLQGAQIGTDLTYGKFRILAFAGLNNIFDKKYVAFVQINSDRQEYYESGPRRNFFSGLNISYLFNR